MLFFKPKPKIDEILPPPPPFPHMELEKEFKEEPKFFDEVVQQESSETFPEEDEFSKLVKGLDEGNKKKPVSKKREKATLKKTAAQKKQKISKKELKQLKKSQVKQIKEKKTASKKSIKKDIKKPKSSDAENFEDFNLEDLDFGLPKELSPEKGIELPETLEELNFDNLGEVKETSQKPKEILEAEEEIRSAIDKIKGQEKPSLFKKLFAKKGKKEIAAAEPIQETRYLDKVATIQNFINKTREALARFDLEAAKKNYIEIMKLYNDLKPEDQAKVYQDIKELYSERKNAEELKV